MTDLSRRSFHKLALGSAAVAAMPAGLSLATASPAFAATSSAVVPIDTTLLVKPTDSISTLAATVLANSNKYGATTWWNTTKNYDAQTGAYLDFGGTAEANIRYPASEASGLATALATGVYSSTLTGVSTTDATAITVRLVSSLAYRHLVNYGTGGWGNGWQTALWASFTGAAGWLVWDSLTSTDAENVRKMVEYEANRFLNYTASYYRKVDGTYNYPGDTQGESIAWNTRILGLAAAMMPNHANHSQWMHMLALMALQARATPMDVGANASKVINGMTLGTVLGGTNINSDFTVVNHDIVHPDYMMACYATTLSSGLTLSLANQTIPYALTRSFDRGYDAFVDLSFTSGTMPYDDPNLAGKTIASPGGAIYAGTSTDPADTSDIYYPMGNDWGTNRRMQFCVMDVFANSFGLDTLASVKSDTWATAHLTRAKKMQERSTDRRTYTSAGEDTYGGREEWVAAYAAWAYLARVVTKSGLYKVSAINTVY
ncbi:hypothetical protein [Streptomyces tubercidicus]|uniref:hypothetical protein n=1 Tax=Streptomyces tubercidicus TaxID=47759 RepID=UPI003690A66A